MRNVINFVSLVTLIMLTVGCDDQAGAANDDQGDLTLVLLVPMPDSTVPLLRHFEGCHNEWDNVELSCYVEMVNCVGADDPNVNCDDKANACLLLGHDALVACRDNNGVCTLNSTDGDSDTDMDGISDSIEIWQLTNPCEPYSWGGHPNEDGDGQQDTDNDGIPDGEDDAIGCPGNEWAPCA